jgi:hypothetical protein
LSKFTGLNTYLEFLQQHRLLGELLRLLFALECVKQASKETYYMAKNMGKRGLLYGQKGPTTWAKETYYMGKRGLKYADF